MHAVASVFFLCLSLSGAAAQQAVNTVITDGKRPFAEGILTGYIVQHGDKTLCENPVAWGRYIACSGSSSTRVWVETNGMLGAYVVVDKDGREVCRDPMVWNQFRGPASYISCQ